VTEPTAARRQRREPELPLWLKVWIAVCVLGGLASLGLIAWAIIATEKVTR
jgi:hypothetical protein